MDDQELDGLYARLRDAEDARQAAVAVIQRQNEAIARVRALLASRRDAVREVEADGPTPWGDTVSNFCAHVDEAIAGPAPGPLLAIRAVDA